jgi:UDP-GlcNAc:undecaprenyl-phosphate GlcNAc-1-phosphate transferase
MGFLLYNFAPAMIFMGDAGSMTIGYVFAVAALWSAGKRSTVMAVMLPLIALGVPILDTLFAFMRRAVTGRSPFRSDRGHIHHRLLDAGLSHRQAVLLLYGVCCVLTGAAVLVRATEDPVNGLMLIGLMVGLAVTARAMLRLSRAVRRDTRASTPDVKAAQAPEDEPAAGDEANASPQVAQSK